MYNPLAGYCGWFGQLLCEELKEPFEVIRASDIVPRDEEVAGKGTLYYKKDRKRAADVSAVKDVSEKLESSESEPSSSKGIKDSNDEDSVEDDVFPEDCQCLNAPSWATIIEKLNKQKFTNGLLHTQKRHIVSLPFPPTVSVPLSKLYVLGHRDTLKLDHQTMGVKGLFSVTNLEEIKYDTLFPVKNKELLQHTWAHCAGYHSYGHRNVGPGAYYKVFGKCLETYEDRKVAIMQEQVEVLDGDGKHQHMEKLEPVNKIESLVRICDHLTGDIKREGVFRDLADIKKDNLINSIFPTYTFRAFLESYDETKWGMAISICERELEMFCLDASEKVPQPHLIPIWRTNTMLDHKMLDEVATSTFDRSNTSPEILLNIVLDDLAGRVKVLSEWQEYVVTAGSWVDRLAYKILRLMIVKIPDLAEYLGIPVCEESVQGLMYLGNLSSDESLITILKGAVFIQLQFIKFRFHLKWSDEDLNRWCRVVENHVHFLMSEFILRHNWRTMNMVVSGVMKHCNNIIVSPGVNYKTLIKVNPALKEYGRGINQRRSAVENIKNFLMGVDEKITFKCCYLAWSTFINSPAFDGIEKNGIVGVSIKIACQTGLMRAILTLRDAHVLEIKMGIHHELYPDVEQPFYFQDPYLHNLDLGEKLEVIQRGKQTIVSLSKEKIKEVEINDVAMNINEPKRTPIFKSYGRSTKAEKKMMETINQLIPDVPFTKRSGSQDEAVLGRFTPKLNKKILAEQKNNRIQQFLVEPLRILLRTGTYPATGRPYLLEASNIVESLIYSIMQQDATNRFTDFMTDGMRATQISDRYETMTMKQKIEHRIILAQKVKIKPGDYKKLKGLEEVVKGADGKQDPVTTSPKTENDGGISSTLSAMDISIEPNDSVDKENEQSESTSDDKFRVIQFKVLNGIEEVVEGYDHWVMKEEEILQYKLGGSCEQTLTEITDLVNQNDNLVILIGSEPLDEAMRTLQLRIKTVEGVDDNKRIRYTDYRVPHMIIKAHHGIDEAVLDYGSPASQRLFALAKLNEYSPFALRNVFSYYFEPFVNGDLQWTVNARLDSTFSPNFEFFNLVDPAYHSSIGSCLRKLEMTMRPPLTIADILSSIHDEYKNKHIIMVLSSIEHFDKAMAEEIIQNLALVPEKQLLGEIKNWLTNGKRSFIKFLVGNRQTYQDLERYISIPNCILPLHRLPLTLSDMSWINCRLLRVLEKKTDKNNQKLIDSSLPPEEKMKKLNQLMPDLLRQKLSKFLSFVSTIDCLVLQNLPSNHCRVLVNSVIGLAANKDSQSILNPISCKFNLHHVVDRELFKIVSSHKDFSYIGQSVTVDVDGLFEGRLGSKDTICTLNKIQNTILFFYTNYVFGQCDMICEPTSHKGKNTFILDDGVLHDTELWSLYYTYHLETSEIFVKNKDPKVGLFYLISADPAWMYVVENLGKPAFFKKNDKKRFVWAKVKNLKITSDDKTGATTISITAPPDPRKVPADAKTIFKTAEEATLNALLFQEYQILEGIDPKPSQEAIAKYVADLKKFTVKPWVRVDQAAVEPEQALIVGFRLGINSGGFAYHLDGSVKKHCSGHDVD